MNADLLCKEIHRCLPDYLEGELSPQSRSDVDAHLADCAECATEVAEMEATVRLLRGLPEPETPPMIAANVMRRIRAGETEPRGLARLRRSLAAVFEPSFVLPASAMAVAALVVVVVQGPAGPQLFGDDASQPGTRVAPARSAAVATLPDTARTPRVPVARRVPPATVMRMEFVERQALAAPEVEAQIRFRQAPPSSALTAQASGFASSDAAGGASLVAGAPLAGSPAPRAIPVAGPAPSIPFESPTRAFDAGPRRAAAQPAPARERSSDSTGAVDVRDEWLAASLRNPREFARFVAGKSLAEQELWVEQIATRAAERGLLGELVEAFESTADASALILADDFRAVVGEPLDEFDR